MADKPPVSWRYVLNTEHLVTAPDSDRTAEMARETGYPYFLWNGKVYKTLPAIYYVLAEPTGVSVERLNAQEVDLCVLCWKPTQYPIDTHIDSRRNYVEGSGQTCEACARNNPREGG